MMSRAIHDLIFKRDWRRLAGLLDSTDRDRKDRALGIVCAYVPVTVGADGRLKWIKDKSKLEAQRMPDLNLLDDLQKAALCTRLAQALRGLGIAVTASDSLSVRLRRLFSDVAVTVDFGVDQKLAENFIKFCETNADLIRRNASLEKKKDPSPSRSEFWLDSSEQSVSVRAISGGAPDSNRRKH